MSKYNTTTGGNTSNYNTNICDQEKMQSGAVILCQHGYLGSAGQFSGFCNLVKKKESITSIVMDKHMTKNISEIDKNLETVCKDSRNNGKMIFIRTEFSNNIGRITEQVIELNLMVDRVKKYINSDVPIILVGHSKGGLVNMRYSITYPGKIAKLVSVGTPYNFNAMGFLQGMLDDVVGFASKTSFLSGHPLLATAFKGIEQLLDWYVSDEDLGDYRTFVDLQRDWNSLVNKPVITTIGCSQIGWKADPMTGGDLVVSIASQLAKGYNGITARPKLSTNYVHIDHFSFLEQLKLRTHVWDTLEDLYNGVTSGDFLVFFLSVILAFFVPDNINPNKYELIHTKECSAEETYYQIMDGIHRAPSSNSSIFEDINY